MPTLIESDLVNIVVSNASNQITVGVLGIQGPAGADGGGITSTSGGVTGVSISGGQAITGAVNINAGSNIVLTQIGLNTFSIASLTGGSASIIGLISTGSADLRYYSINNPSGYITGFNSGLYYLFSNPLNFSSSGNVANTGAAIISLLNNYLLLSQTGQFYPVSNPNNFLRSGDITQSNTSGLATSGNLEATGTSLQSQINNLPVYNLNGLISTGNADLRYLQTGASGAFYSSANPAGYITNSNLNGLISTGAADLRYLTTGASGAFYASSNPANYITASNLNGLANTGYVNSVSGGLSQRIDATGDYLLGLISASSAGVGSLNSASGALTLNGAGNVTVTTIGQTITVSGNTGFLAGYYSVSNPEHYLKSGEASNVNLSGYSTSGNVEATGTALQNQITSIKNGTGVFIQSSNLNGLISTGAADLRYLSSGASGSFYRSSNPNNFSTSGNLESTGTSLQNQINNLPVYNLNGLISTGDVLALNIVYKSGEQNITGYKIFEDKMSQGIGANASGEYSHAQGEDSISIGYGAHAEGFATIAYGDYSHSEGYQTNSSGAYSHAEGLETIAGKDYQSVVGQYNLVDTGALFIIGNGTGVSNRSNVLSVYPGGVSVSGSGNFNSLYVNNSSVITASQTGQFYPASNPLQFSSPVSVWSSLTWNTGTVWSATANVCEDKRILVITGNTTLQITDLYNGWAGILRVIQSGVLQSSGGYSLGLPVTTYVGNAGSGIVYLTSGEGSIDMLAFEYDGNNLFCNIANQFTKKL